MWLSRSDRSCGSDPPGPGDSPPPPVTIRALIDIGSDLTAIHPRILQQFGGRPVGAVQIRRPGLGSDYRLAALSEVQLSIGGVGPGVSWIRPGRLA